MSYSWNGMQKITYEEAVDKWINDKCCQIYLLYDDETESAAESLKDIEKHNKFSGEFGIEK